VTVAPTSALPLSKGREAVLESTVKVGTEGAVRSSTMFWVAASPVTPSRVAVTLRANVPSPVWVGSNADQAPLIGSTLVVTAVDVPADPPAGVHTKFSAAVVPGVLAP
jgi:hypothetical protein